MARIASEIQAELGLLTREITTVRVPDDYRSKAGDVFMADDYFVVASGARTGWTICARSFGIDCWVWESTSGWEHFSLVTDEDVRDKVWAAYCAWRLTN